MNRSIRRGSLMLGLAAGLALVGNAGAQSGAATGDEAGKYSGSSGSQALQERMYEERIRELTGVSAQGDQQSQGMQRQTGMKGAEESSQKMQQEKRQGSAQSSK